jgi:VCBS repeat-containing protein
VWTYTLNNSNATVQALAASATLTDTFTVTAADGTAKTINVTITGANDAAVIAGTSTASLNESNVAQTASGTLTSTDVDGTANLFTAQTAVAGNNGFGSFSITSAGVWAYTMNTAHDEFVAGTAYTDSTTVTAADGTTKVVTVNITGTNDAPVVSVAIPDQTASLGNAFSYTVPAGTFSDPDGTLTYTATRGDGTALPTWLTFNAATRTFSGTPTSTIDFNIKVTASDGVSSISDTFLLALAPVATSVAITGTTGIQNNFLNAGDTITATVNFSELVNVTGTPQLTLNIGGTLVKANYVSGSGTGALTFSYTILDGQTDANGISVNANSLGLNGGTITDAAGNNAVQDFAALTDNISYKVDTTAPAVGTLTLTETGSSFTDGISQNGTITVGALEAGATWEYSTDSGNTWFMGSGTSFTLGQGTYAAGALLMRETDLAGNVQTGPLMATNAAAITVDQTAPLLVGSNPGDNGYLAAVGNNLVLNFDEDVAKGTGAIQLYKADGTLVQSFDAATSTALTWSGNNLTINPTADLLAGTGYYIKVAATAVKDGRATPTRALPMPPRSTSPRPTPMVRTPTPPVWVMWSQRR